MANLVSLTVGISNGQVLPATTTKLIAVNDILSIETVAGVFNDSTLVSRVRVQDTSAIDPVEYYCTNTVASILAAGNAPLA